MKLLVPTVTVPDWTTQSAQWQALNQAVGGNPDFYPLTIKAAYVVGIIHGLCTSVSTLLGVHRDLLAETYLPAFGVCSSGIELLGRCILGHKGTSDPNALSTGLKWLHASAYSTVEDSYLLVTTSARAYDVETLAHLRHFAAHGQATAKQGSTIHSLPDIDTEILGHMPPLITDGLERWWNELRESEDLCNRLALANVIAFRPSPVFKAWSLFEQDAQGKYHSITDVFGAFDWRV